jgi:hypothetical protein
MRGVQLDAVMRTSSLPLLGALKLEGRFSTMMNKRIFPIFCHGRLFLYFIRSSVTIQH